MSDYNLESIEQPMVDLRQVFWGRTDSFPMLQMRTRHIKRDPWGRLYLSPWTEWSSIPRFFVKDLTP